MAETVINNLNKAKQAKKDEFYTRREDIENELCHYAEHFKDKVVYCNCDDPKESEFWQFFVRNFKPWGLKKLIATHYEPDEKNYSYSLEICEDTNGDGKIDWLDEPTIKQLPCNGDFRSDACIELLKEADIVVTNPPFSLFIKYVAQLMEYDKKFIILGNVNAVTYKEFFKLLKENKVWAGFGFNKTMEFIMPDDYELKGKAFIDNDGRKHGFVPSIAWYTNLDIKKRHETLDLRGNYYTPEKYPKYDNYDAIEVSKVSDIPCDYEGVMGVPVTFVDSFNPDQFEILYSSQTGCHPDDVVLRKYKDYKGYKADGTSTGRTGSTCGNNPMLLQCDGVHAYYMNDDGRKVQSTYRRLFIRNKNPQERKYKDED